MHYPWEFSCMKKKKNDKNDFFVKLIIFYSLCMLDITSWISSDSLSTGTTQGVREQQLADRRRSTGTQ